MQTKMLATVPHWVDEVLFTNEILSPDAQSQKIGIIIDNLHAYLANEKHIKAEEQYSLTVNLFACADNPHLYHLIVDIAVFPTELRSYDLRDISQEKLLAGGIKNRIEEASTGHTPPIGPTPPAPLANTGFVTVGDDYNLVQSRIALPLGFAQVLANFQLH